MVIYNLCLFCAFFPMLNPLSACRQDRCFHTEEANFVVVVVVETDNENQGCIIDSSFKFFFCVFSSFQFRKKKQKNTNFSSEHTCSTFRETLLRHLL